MVMSTVTEDVQVQVYLALAEDTFIAWTDVLQWLTIIHISMQLLQVMRKPPCYLRIKQSN